MAKREFRSKNFTLSYEDAKLTLDTVTIRGAVILVLRPEGTVRANTQCDGG